VSIFEWIDGYQVLAKACCVCDEAKSSAKRMMGQA